MVDAIIDALTDPVKEAMAAPPDVAIETCNKSYVSGVTTIYYAEHSYPGKLVNDLSAVRVIAHVPGASPIPGPYHDYVTTPIIRDGAAAITCGANAAVYDKVTFILP